eukprot:7376342-Prymnesium_polylepis.1
MLHASVLAELEAAVPVERRIAPPTGDAASVHTEASSTPSDSSEQSAPTSTESTVTAPSVSSGVSVGVPRDFSGHADGTTFAYNSAAKWVLAALRKLGKDESDIVLSSMEPNDALCSQLHGVIAEWRLSRTTARDAGVIDHRPSELEKPPPQEVLSNTRGWLLREINVARAKKQISMISDDKWGRKLAGVKADAKAVNKKTKELKAASGKLYHHKQDLAINYEEIWTMARVGFTGDQTVHAEILDSMEAGMAFALYMQTGARGGELKKMHIQSLGHQGIQDTDSGEIYDCLQLTAFETKTKAQHLNQILAHANPWSCAVGLLGCTLLVRVKKHGAMPFSMQTNENSWKIIGTDIDTLDDRMKKVFEVAGVRRQLNDVLLNCGRHRGSVLLQHAGGSKEGGDARRGHNSNSGTAAFHYTAAPLPDLLKLACCMYNGKPFVPAHHKPDLFPLVDAVLLILFPELDGEEKALEKRQREVECVRGNREKIRTAEQLNDRQRLLRSLRFACRMALCCLVARPRTWKKWAILESESTIWERATEPNHRVVITLFAGDKDAIKAMEKLAVAVRRAEEVEIAGRLVSPDQAITTQVVTAITEMRNAAAAREAKMLEQMQTLMSMVTTNGEAPAPPE